MLMARRRLKDDGTARRGEWQYLVRWQGLPREFDSWVPEGALDPAWIEAELRAAEAERAAQEAAPTPAA